MSSSKYCEDQIAVIMKKCHILCIRNWRVFRKYRQISPRESGGSKGDVMGVMTPLELSLCVIVIIELESVLTELRVCDPLTRSLDPTLTHRLKCQCELRIQCHERRRWPAPSHAPLTDVYLEEEPERKHFFCTRRRFNDDSKQAKNSQRGEYYAHLEELQRKQKKQSYLIWRKNKSYLCASRAKTRVALAPAAAPADDAG
ncbi:hypothetical protein EVAR_22932_1 [Eumeta japonica]|uniref:Uncharacterized protein n=1 Tax=Eumeta variegata TaxID=151549 RepID=A0A4C1UUX1_EUMVA|nr:hypothetical protein EVAR_22932_1 [Eumeta japonica]